MSKTEWLNPKDYEPIEVLNVTAFAELPKPYGGV
jgi:hypothetical protein